MKKRSITLLLGVLVMLAGCTSQVKKNEEEQKIDDLLSQMTVEEKVGQMTQITLDVICKGKPFDEEKKQELDPALLKEAILDYHVGSILNTGAFTLTREEWYSIISDIQKTATEDSRLKIPVIYGIDAIHGVNYTVGATLFPQELALAATWNPLYAEQMGMVTAYETRASAIPWNFSPVLDLGRQPLWSRFFETLGEDPYLATVMGDAIVKGYQGDQISHPEKVAACLKHYVGYSNSKSGKDRTPIQMSERELREYYLVPFQSAIKNGALTVMINSTEINGTPVHADHHILTDILKDELKFEGFAVTDWEDIVMLHTVHRVASSEKEAVKIAINAGVDMSMVPFNYDFADHLIELVKEGEVPMSRIDDAVRRILRVKLRLGLFEKTHYDFDYYTKFGSEEFRDMSLNAARECITLVKNENNILPLARDKKVLVAGVGGNSLNAQNGAWTHTWQGVASKYNTKGKKTIYESLADKLGASQVVYAQGTDFEKEVNIPEAVSMAKKVDYVVVCLGELPATEKPGDIDDLTYPKDQLRLVKELIATGKPVIAVLQSARPRIFTEVEPGLKAVLIAYLPGDEGGVAIAETILGENNPSGKLPFTYPRNTGALYTYDHKYSETRGREAVHDGFNPLYQFGDGLSYTTFEYSDLKADKAEFGENDEIEVSVKVTNTGQRKGKEVVHLFTKQHYSTITPSVKRLRRFEKIELEPGESKVVSFKLNRKDLQYVDRNLVWVNQPGKFDLIVKDLLTEVEYKSNHK